MAIYKRDIVDINLETGNIHRSYLKHSIGYKDQQADHFGIRVFRDGEPVDLTGVSVQGIFLPPQGSPIAITSGNIVDGNVAEVVLPQACYNYDGQFCLSIKLVDSTNSITGTMRIVDGMVDNTNASGTVAPTSAVPTYQEILSTYDDMVAATAAANGAIAAAYSSSATYAVGDYCIHDGGLYRCTTAITTAEAWTSGHWTAAKIGPDVSALKSAINHDLYIEEAHTGMWAQGKYAVATGNYATDTKLIYSYKYVPTTYVNSSVGLTTTDTYEFSVLCWKISDGTYMGSWTGSGFSKSSNTFFRRPVYFREIGDEYQFAFNVRNRNTSVAVTPSEATNIFFIKNKILMCVEKNQGSANAGKVLVINNSGAVEPGHEYPESDIYEIGNPLQPLTFTLENISATGVVTTYKNAVGNTVPFSVRKGDYVTADEGYYMKGVLYNSKTPNASTFVKTYAWSNSGRIDVDTDGYLMVLISDASHYNDLSNQLSNTQYQYNLHFFIKNTAFEQIAETDEKITENRTISNKTGLFKALNDIASDWHFPFVNVYDEMGLGNNHQIPGTAKTWDASGTVDLTQKNVWMSDGTHPYRGVGLVDMYGRAIANQMQIITPSYHDGAGQSSPTYWAGKRLLWMGTSIPAGSDPYAGSGTGATYPSLVATQLGATVVNIARGSSMLRVKSSSGKYQAIPYSHYLRAVTRMVDECDAIAADWANIYPDVPNAPSTLSADDLGTMKYTSYENLLVPYLDGTNTVPDAIVIDYGHNDYANRSNGERDWWVKPTVDNIENGILAQDTYMTDNNYANLKLALDNDLSGITNIKAFAASLNRNCFQGAYNFLVTVILRYKPYMRVIVVSDYN